MTLLGMLCMQLLLMLPCRGAGPEQSQLMLSLRLLHQALLQHIFLGCSSCLHTGKGSAWHDAFNNSCAKGRLMLQTEEQLHCQFLVCVLECPT